MPESENKPAEQAAKTDEAKPSKAVERLTDLPLSPSLPNSRELAALDRMAQAYSQMPGLNPAYKGKPDAVLAALLTAHSLQLPINPVIVNQFYEVNNRLFPSTQLLIALGARAGISVWFDDASDDKKAVAYAQRAGEERVHSYTYTIEMAAKAKLAEKEVWKQNPDIMLRYRAGSRLLRTVAPDVTLGIPREVLEGDVGQPPVSREELQRRATAITDDEVAEGELV